MTNCVPIEKAEPKQIYVFSSNLGWFAVDWHAAQLHALVFGYANGAEAAGVLLASMHVPVGDSGRRRGAEVCWVDIGQNPKAASGEVRQLAERIQAYADGGCDQLLDIPVALDDATPFQRRVLQQCRRIRYGQTITYGQLAVKAGYPQAARAVGGVMARNRLPLVIPCHRVVGSSGMLRGYSGCGGTATKRRLLELEGAL
jgi:methylated-DNA-[protein]-cysteine S-methyltransferase